MILMGVICCFFVCVGEVFMNIGFDGFENGLVIEWDWRIFFRLVGYYMCLRKLFKYE